MSNQNVSFELETIVQNIMLYALDSSEDFKEFCEFLNLDEDAFFSELYVDFPNQQYENIIEDIISKSAVVILSPQGSGKTTLLRKLSREINSNKYNQSEDFEKKFHICFCDFKKARHDFDKDLDELDKAVFSLEKFIKREITYNFFNNERTRKDIVTYFTNNMTDSNYRASGRFYDEYTANQNYSGNELFEYLEAKDLIFYLQEKMKFEKFMLYIDNLDSFSNDINISANIFKATRRIKDRYKKYLKTIISLRPDLFSHIIHSLPDKKAVLGVQHDLRVMENFADRCNAFIHELENYLFKHATINYLEFNDILFASKMKEFENYKVDINDKRIIYLEKQLTEKLFSEDEGLKILKSIYKNGHICNTNLMLNNNDIRSGQLCLSNFYTFIIKHKLWEYGDYSEKLESLYYVWLNYSQLDIYDDNFCNIVKQIDSFTNANNCLNNSVIKCNLDYLIMMQIMNGSELSLKNYITNKKIKIKTLIKNVKMLGFLEDSIEEKIYFMFDNDIIFLCNDRSYITKEYFEPSELQNYYIYLKPKGYTFLIHLLQKFSTYAAKIVSFNTDENININTLYSDLTLDKIYESLNVLKKMHISSFEIMFNNYKMKVKALKNEFFNFYYKNFCFHIHNHKFASINTIEVKSNFFLFSRIIRSFRLFLQKRKSYNSNIPEFLTKLQNQSDEYVKSIDEWLKEV